MCRRKKLYGDWLMNAESASKKCLEIQRSERFDWLKECRQWAGDLTDKADLGLLLLGPVQSLSEYERLLTDLLEVTPNDHPDYNALRSALRKLNELEPIR
jgi:hypothetical protein